MKLSLFPEPVTYVFIIIVLTMLLIILLKHTTLYYSGVYAISVSALQEPPEYLRVRDIKEWYVDYLVKMLLEEGDCEDLTSPLLVLASVTREEFREKNIDQYTFKVRL